MPEQLTNDDSFSKVNYDYSYEATIINGQFHDNNDFYLEWNKRHFGENRLEKVLEELNNSFTAIKD